MEDGGNVKTLIRIIALTFAVTAALPASADFRRGVEAFQAGNHAEAARFWRSSAEAGEPASQRNLGLLYLEGLGVEKDPARAARWFRLAAEQSFAPAAAHLSVLYLQGLGVPQDRGKAAEYMRIAAEGGLAESQYNLGLFYERGIGVEKDEDAAIFWHRRAAGQGFEQSVKRLARLSPEAAKEFEKPDAREQQEGATTRTAASRPEPTGDGLVDSLVTLFKRLD